jgi:transcription initiation factor TFIIE subunit beta
VLARIVRHMKHRHMEGEDHPLGLEEILDETNQLDVSGKTRHWLQAEALNHNPKIEVTDDHRYMFRAPFKLRDKKSLIKMLKRKDLNGEGGVFYDDVMESLPKAEKIVKGLREEGKIIEIPRPVDKKKVLFYYDHTTDLDIGAFVLSVLLGLADEILSSISASGGDSFPLASVDVTINTTPD